MGKVNLLVKYCLRNDINEYNIKGIFINNQIKFMDKDSKMLLDKKQNILIRDTNELEIKFDFSNKKCFIKEKSSNINIDFDINILELINLDSSFKVKYKIQDDEYLIYIKIN